MPPLPEHAPVVIVGGGPVGTALALALQGGHASPVLLEARSTAAETDDSRFLALSFGSRLILERLAVWAAIEPHATPIRHVEVTQRGGFGRTELAAGEVGLPALGYVVRYRDLVRALNQAFAPHAHCASGAVVRDVKVARDFAAVDCSIDGESQLVSTSLLALADGGGHLAAKSGFPGSLVRDYHQWAVVAWIELEEGHGHKACERFTPHGPAALLPAESGYSVVLTSPEAESRALAALSDEDFLDRLRAIFGARVAGAFRCSPRVAFPLAMRYAASVVRERVALVGNAAQTLHPVAGQGYNLGLRDAWSLAQVVVHSSAQDLGDRAMLDRYRKARARDRTATILATDSLVRLFSNDMGWLQAARGMGLAMLDFSDAAKHFLMRRMMFGS